MKTLILAVIAAFLALILFVLYERISALEKDLTELEMRQKAHDREVDEFTFKAENWKNAANYRFSDDEKDVAELKAQCERFKGYIYRQTGEKI